MARRTHAKTAHDGGETIPPKFSEPLVLACGCKSKGRPGVSNPDKWWCCGGWQRRKA